MFKKSFISILGLICFTIVFIISLYLKYSFISLLSSIILFTTFDIVGFYHLLTKEQTISYNKNDIPLILYRILQISLQIVLVYVLISFNMIPEAILFMFCWWFGLCDYLYYIFLNQDFTKYGNMFWLWWSIPGIVYGKDKVNGRNLIIFANGAFIVSIIVEIILHIFY